jgi:excinuclease Cho
MMAQVRRVEHIRTAGEVGALLLESRLIKARQPLYNQRLRRAHDLCSWHLAGEAARPVLVYSRDVAFAHVPDLYGLYSSARRAREFLLELAQARQLCLATLGLEAPTRRGCFGLQIGRCAGACVGCESAAAHAARLREALQTEAVQRWPFEGPVGLVERDGDWVQTHVVDGWRHLRTEDNRGPADAVGAAPQPGFDLDAYRILVRPLLAGDVERVHLRP